MTNTELIRQEIERRIGAMYNFSSGYSALNVCRELLDFIDSLSEEKETSFVLIGDSDYQVVHTTVYGCGDEMSPEISVELDDMFKPNEEVKVIVVKKRKE